MFLWLKSSVFRCQRSATLSVELHMNVMFSYLYLIWVLQFIKLDFLGSIMFCLFSFSIYQRIFIWPFIFMFSMCFYNVQSKLPIVFIFVPCYTSAVTSFVNSFEKYEINWIEVVNLNWNPNTPRSNLSYCFQTLRQNVSENYIFVNKSNGW